MGTLFAGALALGLLATPEPSSVAVLVLAGEDGEHELYDSARATIEANTALRVELLDARSSIDREAIRGCAGDGRCFVARLGQAGVSVDLMLAISVDRIGEGTLFGLRLIDTREAARGQKAELGVLGEELPPGAAPARVIADYVARVFPPELWGRIAALSLEVRPADAVLTVGATPCASPCRFARLPPGEYAIRAGRPGYLAHEETIALAPREERRLSIELRPEPSRWFASPWLWAAVGVAVAGAAVGVGVAVASGDGVEICFGDANACR